MANNYNDALERAKQAIIDCGSNASRKEMIYGIFPELRESEDERIRKALIKLLNEGKDLICWAEMNGYNLKDAIAYLEKQKEQHLEAINSEGGSSEIPNNQWSEEDKAKLDRLCSITSHSTFVGNKEMFELQGWLKSLPERIK